VRAVRRRGYPLAEFRQRVLPAGYDGPVFVSDIDKTYLATRFSSMKGLARIPIELAVDKQAVAGMTEILRGVRRGPGPGFAAAPLYFISSSPPQLRRVIERKMLLDGVQPDGFVFKDWLRTLGEGKPKRLKEHVAFKLTALLRGRLSRPDATEYLFGDDVERDPETYSLYGRLLAGELEEDALEAELREYSVAPADRQEVQTLLASLPARHGRVAGAFILLVRGRGQEALARGGPAVTVVRDAYQLGLALLDRGLVDERCVAAVRACLRDQGRRSEQELGHRLAEAVERGLVSGSTADRLRRSAT